MKHRRLLAGSVLGLALVGGMGAAHAGTAYQSFNTTVAPFNGSGYTSYQSKAVTGAAGNLSVGTVGGSYVVDARLEGPTGTGSWSRDVNDGQFRNLYNSINAGQLARVQFSNDFNTAVHVQVTGSWRSY